MVILLYLIILVLSVTAVNLYKNLKSAEQGKQQLTNCVGDLNGVIESLTLGQKDLEDKLKKVEGQKKSSEVRTGLIVEQMAPFLTGFPADPKTCVFVGKPLDFIAFEESGIRFIEVKSGNAQLNPHQRQVRDLIESGKVTFEVYRIKGE